MRLKCIGGIRDGHPCSIDDSKNDITLKDLPNASITASCDTAGDFIAYKIEQYTRRTISFSNGSKVQYLAPIDWTDEHSLTHLLEHYNANPIRR